ncbi:MAG: tyrosine--tRNA ligase [Chloroflexi bacterium]|nr:tyrosine--tRNA ligase [Chloroflexota bacterium]
MKTLDFNKLLRRGVAEIISEQELIKLLESGKPLRLKQGFDPSRPDIHLGHVVGLRKLRQFQELGHHVILIVGDWTAQIGDPSGVSATRTMLSAEEVKANARTYMEQFFKVIDKDKTEVRWQSDWFGKFNLADVIRLTSRFTVAQFLAREDFHNRYAAGKPIAITELLYPLLQAYDSVEIDADVEFGGVDQKFNCLVGRELQGMLGKPQQQVFLMPLLVGTDGVHKKSKSQGNYEGVTDPPNDMYGKIMSIPDTLILSYFELLTDEVDEELEKFREQMNKCEINPMVLKKRLARDIVQQFHGREGAMQAEEHFTTVFQRRQKPEEMAECVVIAEALSDALYRVDLVTMLLDRGIAKSKAEVKRLLAQGAIEIEGKKVDTALVDVPDGAVAKVGKRGFLRMTIKQTRS